MGSWVSLYQSHLFYLWVRAAHPFLTHVAVVGEGTEDLVSQKSLFDRSRMKEGLGRGREGEKGSVVTQGGRKANQTPDLISRKAALQTEWTVHLPRCPECPVVVPPGVTEGSNVG